MGMSGLGKVFFVHNMGFMGVYSWALYKVGSYFFVTTFRGFVFKDNNAISIDRCVSTIWSTHDSERYLILMSNISTS